MKNLSKAINEWIKDFGSLDLDTTEEKILSHYNRKIRKEKLKRLNKNNEKDI